MPMWFVSPSGLQLPKRHSDTFPTGIPDSPIIGRVADAFWIQRLHLNLRLCIMQLEIQRSTMSLPVSETNLRQFTFGCVERLSRLMVLGRDERAGLHLIAISAHGRAR
jgi:hypothetical protein